MEFFVFIFLLILPFVFLFAGISMKNVEKTIFYAAAFILFFMSAYFFLTATEGVKFDIQESIPTTASITMPCSEVEFEMMVKNNKKFGYSDFYCQPDRDVSKRGIYHAYMVNGSLTFHTADLELLNFGTHATNDISYNISKITTPVHTTSYIILNKDSIDLILQPIMLLYTVLGIVSMLMLIQDILLQLRPPTERRRI